MRFLASSLSIAVTVAVALAPSVAAQSDEFRVYTNSPRLMLTAARLRLLQRERERQTPRWQQFDAFVSGGAPMPEPGFAYALYYRASDRVQWAKQAMEWALSDKASPQKAGDLRQLALVYDWCEKAAAAEDLTKLSQKIQRGIAAATASDVNTQSARALAAIAIADEYPDHGEAVLKPIVEEWWRKGVIAKINAGEAALPREQTYALMEFLHAIRDNLKVDLRTDAPEFFKNLPTDHLVSHYPAPLETPENLFRVPIYVRNGEPSIEDAVFSRAAELAMVAYDSNAAETQFLQGWLMQDRYMMRGQQGVAYEFLWANPYQPGLSYFQVPLVYHDGTTGHLFARTSWDEDAIWLGYFNGVLQVFRKGAVETLKKGTVTEPVRVGDAVILTASGTDAARFRADAAAVFVTGLERRAKYEVEIEDQELQEETTDTGGTMALQFLEGLTAEVRIKRRAD